MISEKLKIIVNNPEVIYLYDMRQFSLRKHRYIAITQPNSGHKVSIEADEDIDLLCIPINKWFKKVTNGELIA